MFNKMKYIFVSEGRFTTFASIMNNHPKSPIIDLQQQQLLLRVEYEHERRNSSGRLKQWVSPAK